MAVRIYSILLSAIVLLVGVQSAFAQNSANALQDFYGVWIQDTKEPNKETIVLDPRGLRNSLEETNYDGAKIINFVKYDESGREYVLFINRIPHGPNGKDWLTFNFYYIMFYGVDNKMTFAYCDDSNLQSNRKLIKKADVAWKANNVKYLLDLFENSENCSMDGPSLSGRSYYRMWSEVEYVRKDK
jgi:hypothetical protein